MAESERIFAAIRNIGYDIYVTSFADEEELDWELSSREGQIELVDSSKDYKAILKVLESDTTPSMMERIVNLSTNKSGELNPRSLLWFLKKRK